MNLLSHLSRSVHQLQHGLHRHWPEHPHATEGPPSGAVVLTVALLSVAAAAMLVLAP